jgi:hypothetical protein
VLVRVFSCSEAELGDPLGGVMQCEGIKRPSVARWAQQARERWEGEGRWRETVGGRELPFIQLESGGRPVHARSPIRWALNPGSRTPRSGL